MEIGARPRRRNGPPQKLARHAHATLPPTDQFEG